MFAATIDITIDGVAKTLNRISDGNYSSEYYLRETDGEFTLRIRNSKYSSKGSVTVMHRHNVELVHNVFPSGAVPAKLRKAYVVLENEAGDGLTDPVDFNVGFVGFLTETNITKLINFES
jgi:hypothetical protein